jgi:hypothetical protein
MPEVRPPLSAPPAAARGRVLLPVITAVALGVLGWSLRNVEVDAEADLYHATADALRNGDVPVTPYHPYGLPLLGALVGPLAGDTLRALRLLAAIAAGVVVSLTGAFAERLRPGAGAPARWLAAASPMVWWLGTMGSSDMVGAALLLSALALAVCGDGGIAPRRAFAIGVLLGFGTGVRYAVALGVPLAAAWALARRTAPRAFLAAAAGLALGFLPNALVQVAATGTAFPADGWHNFYLELVCGFDLERLHEEQRTNTLPTRDQFLREHGSELFVSGVHDTVTAARHVLPGMLLGTRHAPGWAHWWPVLLAALGLLAARPRRRGAALLATALALVYGSGVLLDPRPRLLLPVLPLLLAGLAVGVHALPSVWLRRAVLAAALLAPLPLGVAHFRAYLAEDPGDEIAVVRTLRERLARPLVVMTTSPVLQRHAAVRAAGYVAPPQPDLAATWAAIRARMATAGADVFVTGAASRAGLFALLRDAVPPPDLELLHRDARVLALGRVVPPSPWIASFAVEPAAPRAGEPVTLRLTIAADVPLERRSAAGVAVRAPDGSQDLVTLALQPDGSCAHTLPLAAGSWSLTPFVLDRDGNVHRGAARVLEVRGP